MLVKVRAINLKNPKGEVGKERLPVEVVENTIFIDPKTILSICTYPIHSPEYMDAEEKRTDKAIIAKYGSFPKLCRVNTRDGFYFVNIFLEDILPHIQIYEHGLQRNAEG